MLQEEANGAVQALGEKVERRAEVPVATCANDRVVPVRERQRSVLSNGDRRDCVEQAALRIGGARANSAEPGSVCSAGGELAARLDRDDLIGAMPQKVEDGRDVGPDVQDPARPSVLACTAAEQQSGDERLARLHRGRLEVRVQMQAGPRAAPALRCELAHRFSQRLRLARQPVARGAEEPRHALDAIRETAPAVGALRIMATAAVVDRRHRSVDRSNSAVSDPIDGTEAGIDHRPYRRTGALAGHAVKSLCE